MKNLKNNIGFNRVFKLLFENIERFGKDFKQKTLKK